MVRPRARAEELVGDVFLKIHQAAPRYIPSARFTTWMYTIAYRTALNAQSKRRHQLDEGVGGDLELSEAPSRRRRQEAGTTGPERSLAIKRALLVLDEAIAALPSTHRAAVLLYYAEGMSCAEAALALGETADTVKSRLAYARRILRQQLGTTIRDLPEGGRS